MKVYVITCGEYSDYRICAATLDKEKAEKLKEKFDHYDYTGANIEEYETDESDYYSMNNLYTVSFRESGDVTRVEEEKIDSYTNELVKMSPMNEDGLLHITVWAKNATDAIKIAAEKRAKYLAEEQGM